MGNGRLLLSVLCTIIITCLTLTHKGHAQPLQQYNIDVNSITMSGVSSGGAAAVQFHVAFSKMIKGVAAIAAPPYWCAMNQVAVALTACTKDPSLISVSTLWAATNYAYATGTIDNPKELASSKVWLYTGKNDTVVIPGVVDKTLAYYRGWVGDSNIQFHNTIDSEHAWITNRWGNACRFFGEPYINDCDFDAAGSFLNWFYGDLSPRANSLNTSNVIMFAQRFYTPLNVPPSSISIGDIGFIYVPTSCQSGEKQCKLHVVLHGCRQGAGIIGNTFILHSGVNEWAETNNIIVLYPQAIISDILPYNPKGCWDWWGYTLPDYATQIGPQMATISNMIKAVTGK